MKIPLLLLLPLLAAASLPAQTVLVEKPEFRTLVAEDAALEKLASGFQFLEGPAWEARTSTLIFSDIPADHLYRFDPAAPAGTTPAIFRDPSNHANGNMFDAAGNLLTCEQGARRVSLTHPDGSVETLADRFEGKLLNSPNDVAVWRDGTIWFTDPTYGLEKRPREQEANRVYRFDPKTRTLHAVLDDGDQPNGICFSPDGTRLYVADTGKPHNVRIFEVDENGSPTHGRVFCVVSPGAADGIRCDRAGNLWATAGDGAQIFSPAGERLGKILVPETPANLCFGGPAGDDLYLTAKKSLYRIKVLTGGAPVIAAPADLPAK